MSELRIVSLIPSATEIVAYLGFADALVGRSHECDFPVQVRHLPVCTSPRFDPSGRSREIHDRVTTLLQQGLSVYDVDLEQLRRLQPTHIITQAQCEVCAVSLAEVQAAVAQVLEPAPLIISLEPRLLADLWSDLVTVATALDPTEGPDRALKAVKTLQTRLQNCIQQVPQRLPQPTVACLEWTDPLMGAGNWVPELVALAGGHPLFGQVGRHSAWLSWQELQESNPDILVVMPCGYDLEQGRQAVEQLEQQPEWSTLQAVLACRIYIVDGNQYFNRPGPRLVDSLEILAEILHTDDCQFGYALKAWKLY